MDPIVWVKASSRFFHLFLSSAVIIQSLPAIFMPVVTSDVFGPSLLSSADTSLASWSGPVCYFCCPPAVCTSRDMTSPLPFQPQSMLKSNCKFCFSPNVCTFYLMYFSKFQDAPLHSTLA
ncbi:hypothetical protein WA026_020620 [Henosepilachna vigintioctopunctata]|uniref:Uncharacterized protein n=1 Tax=Henosepilachna vigintioctopunctata TaxID=420089 RepID=A0AAW1V354_9CUCU